MLNKERSMMLPPILALAKSKIIAKIFGFSSPQCVQQKKHTLAKRLVSMLMVSLAWALLHSATQAQNPWKPANGPYGGTVWDVLVNEKGQVFAGTDGAGIFVSDDAGASWKPVSNGLSNLEVRALASNLAGELFAGTNGGGIFRSTDDAQSWQPVNSGLSGGHFAVFSIAYEPESQVLYAGTGAGVLRSFDNGDLWEVASAGLPQNVAFEALAINPVTLEVLAGAPQAGLFRSADQGGNWQQLDSGFGATSILIGPDNLIFAGTADGVFLSRDNGGAWTPVNNGLDVPVVQCLTAGIEGQIFAGTDGGGLYRTANLGASWMLSGEGLMSSSIRTIASGINAELFVGTSGASAVATASLGVYRSTDGGNSWELANEGLTNTKISALLATDRGSLIAGTLENGIFRSRDSGGSWELLPRGAIDGAITDLLFDPFSQGAILAAVDGFGAGIFRSSNDGDNWVQFTKGLENAPGIRKLALNSRGELWAAGDDIYLSQDNGSSWQAQNIGLAEELIVELFISDQDHLFAATGSLGLLRSTDNGASWQPADTGLQGARITAMTQTQGGELLAASTTGALFGSSDDGQNWNPAGTLAQRTPITELLTAPNGLLLAIAGNRNVLVSSDDGQSWQALNDGLPMRGILSLDFDNQGQLFAGTDGQGVWINALPQGTQDVFWATAASGNWSNPQNWSTQAVPGPLDRVFITQPGDYIVTLDVDAEVAQLELGAAEGAATEKQVLLVDGRTLTLNGNAKIDPQGVLQGEGVIAADLIMAGQLLPGSPVGSLEVQGDYTQTQSGELELEIGSASQFDRLIIRGAANLSGNLAIQLRDGFVPTPGARFPLISFASRTGEFAAINGLIIDDALRFVSELGATDFTLNTVAPSITFAPQTIDFGEVLLGDSVSRTIIMTNNGAITLSVTAISITGPHTADFQLQDPGGGAITLQPGQNFALTIEFQPSAEGLRTAELGISSNALSSPDVAPLRGAGVQPFDLFTQLLSGPVLAETNSSTSSSWSDFDLDGDADLFVTTSDAEMSNLLFANDGNGNLSKVEAGDLTSDVGRSFAATWGDVDNDGDADVFVANDENDDNFFYRNNGDGTFTRIIDSVVGNDGGFSVAASWADFDNDGNLDLFVANRQNGNFLYRNEGAPAGTGQIGSFTKITAGAIVTDAANSLGGAWSDYDNDGDIDLFVVNGGGQNNALYRNDGAGAFSKIIDSFVAADGGDSRGCSWGDFDNDGDFDLFVTNGNGEANFLYRNNGDGSFAKITDSAVTADVANSTGSAWGDFDSDGDLDLLVANNALALAENVLFLNEGGVFARQSLPNSLDVSIRANGTSLSDIDSDGDLDFFIANGFGQRDLLYLNNGNSNNWISVRLIGRQSNRAAVGAKIRLHTDVDGQRLSQVREISAQTGGGYGGQNALSAFFGLGAAQRVDSLIVEWPAGGKDSLGALVANQFLAMTETVVDFGEISVVEPEQPQAGDSLLIDVMPPQNFATQSGQLFYRAAGETVYRSVPINLSEGGLNAIIPPLDVTERGVQYYIAIFDGQTTITLPPVDPQNNPRFIPSQVRRRIADVPLEPEQFRMISVPLNLAAPAIDSVLFDDYGVYQTFPRIWRLFRWGTLDYQEYTDIGAAFTPGTAFWLITRDGEPFDVENATSVDPSTPFQISLRPGWNQIATPFAFPVAWQSIIADGAVQNPVFYNGDEYIFDVPVLEPWEGYFVFNLSLTTTTLTIPPIEAVIGTESRAKHSAPHAIASKTDDFTLQISARVDGDDFRDTQNFAGFRRGAAAGWDENDFFDAPAITGELTVSLIADDELYAGNFLPADGEGGAWELQIASELPKRQITVSLHEFGNLPPNFQIYLFDLQKEAIQPVRNGTFHLVTDAKETRRRYKIVVGNEGFAAEAAGGLPLTPLEFELEQNYPNPFNPSTTIGYQLQETSAVELAIYNQMGQRVATLVDAKQRTGRYEVHWNGRDAEGKPLASGIYMCRLRAGDRSQTRKMLLLH